MFKYETHLHTSRCSKCGGSTGHEFVDTAKKMGYAGIVITNHFWGGNTCIDKNIGWENFVKAYKEDYLDTLEYGLTQGVDVFFGLEDGIGGGKEILIYGVDPDDLIAHPEYLELPLKGKIDLLHSLGGIVFQAHPFRDRCYIDEPDVQPDPTLFEGVEAFNQYNAEGENPKAFAYAEKYGLIAISGSDVHEVDGFGNCGIEFTEKPKDYADLLAKIMQRDFTLLAK